MENKEKTRKKTVKKTFRKHGKKRARKKKSHLPRRGVRMFDPKMFYTAVSRAKTIEQISIIMREEQKYKFEFAKIYKITSKNGVYIGSTTKNIDKRFAEHRYSYEQYKIGKGKYMTSFLLLDDSKVKIEMIERFKCNDIKDLWEREKEIIQSTVCVNKTYNEIK